MTKEEEKKELELSALNLIVDELREENTRLCKDNAKLLAENISFEAQINVLTEHNTELQKQLNQREERPVWD